MSLKHITVQNWRPELTEQALALLKKHQATSLFLLSNLKEYGPKQTEALFSGDYQCLVKQNKVIGVFVLTRSGRLLIQTDGEFDYSNLIIDNLLPKIKEITCLVGAWELITPLWQTLLKRFSTLKTSACKKEILYQCDLKNLDQIPINSKVKFLTKDDYFFWNKLNTAFCKELNSILYSNELERKQLYLQQSSNKHWWGLFVNKQLTVIAAYNAKFEDWAQIGGVYTLPQARGQGLAKQLMQQIMLDSKNIHKVKTLVLFTDVTNYIAQKVYQALGFTPIGYFGLTTGKWEE